MTHNAEYVRGREDERESILVWLRRYPTLHRTIIKAIGEGVHRTIDPSQFDGYRPEDISVDESKWHGTPFAREPAHNDGSVWTAEKEVNQRAERFADEVAQIVDRDSAPTEGAQDDGSDV